MTDAAKPITDMDQAILNPASVFATPEAVLLHESLSKQQKIELLGRWAYDASEICVAVEEGMPGGENNTLRQVLVALDQLCDGVDVDQVGPTKQHGIPRSALEPK